MSVWTVNMSQTHIIFFKFQRFLVLFSAFEQWMNRNRTQKFLQRPVFHYSATHWEFNKQEEIEMRRKKKNTKNKSRYGTALSIR